MRHLGLVVALVMTCLGGYLVGRRRHALSRQGLRGAAAAALETIGVGVLFLAANLALVLGAVLAARALTDRFVSVYGIDGVTIAAVSLFQGLVYRWWRERG